MSDLNRRLDRLGDRFGEKGCSVCESWGLSRVYIIDPRAAEVPDMTRPPSRCPSCRRRIMKYDDVRIICGDDDDARGGERWDDRPESPIEPAPDAPVQVVREYAGVKAAMVGE